MYGAISNHFRALFPFLSQTDIEQVILLSKMVDYNIGDLILAEGDQTKKFGFLLSGLIRIYFVRDQSDYTFEFRGQYDVFGNLDMIFSHRPSGRYFEVLEPSKVMLIDYIELEKLFVQNPRIEAVRTRLLEENFYQMVLKMEEYLWLSPEERYQRLLLKTPDLLQRVPQKYIATYLGITPVSLSRIRKRIST